MAQHPVHPALAKPSKIDNIENLVLFVCCCLFLMVVLVVSFGKYYNFFIKKDSWVYSSINGNRMDSDGKSHEQ